MCIENRKLHLDVLRIIAILLVIYNHTNEKGFFLFSISENVVLVPVYTFFSVMCSIAVPIFFMISGALLIPKQETIRSLYKKRVGRIFLVILLFSFIQYLYQVVFLNVDFSLLYFFNTIFSSRVIIPYWYLYSYAAYILIIPFLRKLATVMTGKDYFYLFLLQLVINGVCPILSYFLKLGDINLYLPVLENIIFYPLVGNYLENQLPSTYFNNKYVSVCSILSFVIMALFVFLTWQRANAVGELSEYGNGLFITSLIAIPVVTVYFGVKYICSVRQVSLRVRRIIALFGDATFGIYLLEERFREFFVFIDLKLAPFIGWMPACMVWILVTFLASFLATCILKKIPGIKKLL